VGPAGSAAVGWGSAVGWVAGGSVVRETVGVLATRPSITTIQGGEEGIQTLEKQDGLKHSPKRSPGGRGSASWTDQNAHTPHDLIGPMDSGWCSEGRHGCGLGMRPRRGVGGPLAPRKAPDGGCGFGGEGEDCGGGGDGGRGVDHPLEADPAAPELRGQPPEGREGTEEGGGGRGSDLTALWQKKSFGWTAFRRPDECLSFPCFFFVNYAKMNETN